MRIIRTELFHTIRFLFLVCALYVIYCLCLWSPQTAFKFLEHPSRPPSVPFSDVFSSIPDEYLLLFKKTLKALEFLYEQYPNFDWYYKADDDTYVVMENLRNLLTKYDPAKPYYIGYRMKPYLLKGYNAGGAGYVLSRAALALFVEKLASNRTLCPLEQYEDVGIGKCFMSLGIYPIDTRNEKGQQRFNTYNAADIFHKKIGDEWIFDKQIPGFDAMAADLISLHHLSPDEIRTYDQLIYKVRPHLGFRNKTHLGNRLIKFVSKFL